MLQVSITRKASYLSDVTAVASRSVATQTDVESKYIRKVSDEVANEAYQRGWDAGKEHERGQRYVQGRMVGEIDKCDAGGQSVRFGEFDAGRKVGLRGGIDTRRQLIGGDNMIIKNVSEESRRRFTQIIDTS